jgi:penicillin amidase
MYRSVPVALLALGLFAGAALAAGDSVTVLRDAYGVPHIFTHGRAGARRGSYANGYVQAEDRLFEMDILRRAATGRLAESVVLKASGMDFLPMDKVARRDGFTAAERVQLYRRLPARDRQALAAYRDGVNAFIAKVTANPQLLPLEFLGTPPARWEVGDSVAVGVLEMLVEGANGGQEVLNADLFLDLLARFPETEAHGVFNDLIWMDEPAAPTTIASEDGTATAFASDHVQRFAAAQVALVTRYAASIRQAADVLRGEQGLMGGLGRTPALPIGLRRHASNAIVIGPALSASGHPILLGGPQTGLNAPSFFWEVGLHGAYEAEGVTAPAGPGVLIGRGRNFAMTITSGILDNVDTFIEVLDPADPTRYRFRGRWLPFERRTETIKVAGQPDLMLEVLRTVHGPVFYLDREGGVAFSRRAAFRGRELESAAAVLNLGYVRSLGGFRRLADRMAMSFNLHYADAAGNIAYFHRGVRPRRPLHTDPRLPLDGTGTMEWRGVDPPDRMPSVVNPQRGFITNWNNKPITGWSSGEQREQWGVVDRVGVFVDALEAARTAGTHLTPADVKALMRHAAVSDIFAHHVVPFLEDALDTLPVQPDDIMLRTAVANVRAWVDAGASLAAVTPEHQGVVPDPGAAIYTTFRDEAQRAVLGDELGGALRAMFYPSRNDGEQEDDHGSFGSPDALFLRVLLSAGAVPGAAVPAGLLPVSRDYFTDVTSGTPHTRAEVLVGALRAALDTLTMQFGSDQNTWQLPALRERYRDLGSISNFFGLTEMERENRGSFNLVVDFAPPVSGEIIVPPGEVGTFTASDVGHEPPRQPFTMDELEPPVTPEPIPGR